MKIAIIEDEKDQVDLLKTYIKRYSLENNFEIDKDIKVFYNGGGVIFSEEYFDLIFLEICIFIVNLSIIFQVSHCLLI